MTDGRYVIHFLSVSADGDGPVTPACGSWELGKSWTRDRDVVTCPSCLALLFAPGPGARPAAGSPGADPPRRS